MTRDQLIAHLTLLGWIPMQYYPTKSENTEETLNLRLRYAEPSRNLMRSRRGISHNILIRPWNPSMPSYWVDCDWELFSTGFLRDAVGRLETSNDNDP